MNRIVHYLAGILLAGLALTNPAAAGTRKPLVMSAAGQVQPIQASDILVVEFPRSGTIGSNFNYLFNPIGLGVWSTSDSMTSSATPGTNIPTLFSVEQYFGGSTVNDGRNALGVALHMTSATSTSSTYPFFAALNVVADTAYNIGGTNVAPKGYLYGGGTVCRMKSGATYWQACIGNDSEVSVETGASVAVKAAYAAGSWPSDGVHGNVVDAAYWIFAAPGGVGFTNGIQIDNNGGAAPIPTSGTVLKALGGWTTTNGIDLSGITLTGNLLKGGGTVALTSTTPSTSTSTGVLQVAGGIGVAGAAYFGGVVVPPTFTIAGLPTCNAGLQGARANVSNGQATPAFMGSVSTTGSQFAPVVCINSAWLYG